MSRIPAKLWKLALVAALGVAAFTLPTPRNAEASPCTVACQNQYIACRDACADNCRTRVPCYSDCVDGCLVSKQYCVSHC
jgi:hypothetical protein